MSSIRISYLVTISVALLILCTPSDPQAQDYDWASIDEESFESFQPTEKIMETIGVAEGMSVGEVGAGGGRVAVRVARMVGPSGRVYANDITASALEYMRRRLIREKITNMVVIEGTLTDPRFPENTLDVVYLTNTYRHLDRPLEVLRNIGPSLKPSGRLGVIDMKRYRLDAERASGEQVNPVIRTAAEAGFRLVKLETSLPRDDIYVFERKIQSD